MSEQTFSRTDFFTTIFEPEDAFIELRAIHPDRTASRRTPFQAWYRSDELSALADTIAELNEHLDIYIGINPRNGQLAGDANVATIRCVFADFDDVPEAAEVTRRITAAGLPRPSLLVFSGGGFHAYWRLTDAIAPEVFTDTQRRLSAALGSDGRVCNPERLMRLPDTVNRKPHRDGARCRVVDRSGRRFTLDDITGPLPPSPGPDRAPRTPSAGPGDQADGEPASDSAVQRAVAAMARIRPPATENDGSRRLFAWACRGVEAGLCDDQIVAAIREVAARPGLSFPLTWSDRHVLDRVRDARRRTSPQTDLNQFALTDAGNAEAFVALHCGDFRYVGSRKHWIRWTGQCWEVDQNKSCLHAAFLTARGRQAAAARSDDERVREPVGKHAKSSESCARLEAMVRIAASDPAIAVSPNELDAQDWLFNCENGTLDLRTGQLRPHCPDDLLTQRSPVAFDPDAACPAFDTFLEQTFQADQDLIAYIDQVLAFCLTGCNREQKIYIAHGSGANGKSVLFDLIDHIMGDFSCLGPETLLTLERTREHSTEVAGLRGKRLVLASELEPGKILRTALVKRLTGDARITARRMYQNFEDFTITFKIILTTNHLPTVSDFTSSIWRRVVVVPFRHQVAEPDQDPALLEHLKGEAAGVLARLVRSIQTEAGSRIVPPAAVVEASAAYRADQDPLADFLDRHVEVTRNPRDFVSRGQLATRLTTWANQVDEEKRVDPPQLYARLRLEHAVDDRRRVDGHQQRGFVGVRTRRTEAPLEGILPAPQGGSRGASGSTTEP